MGAQCVRISPKPQRISYKNSRETVNLRGSQEVLQFQIAISNLELHCTLNNISQVMFRVKGCFQLSFQRCDFSIHEKIIKCSGVRQSVFQVNAKEIEHLYFETLILDSKGTIIEKFAHKMHAICQGPRNHDHLLKQMKSRIIFSLDISQMVVVNLCCSSISVKNYEKQEEDVEYAYSVELLGGDEQERESEKKIMALNGPKQVQSNLRKVLPTNKLKQSIISISLFKKVNRDYGQDYEEITHMHFPYMKLSRSNDACLITDNSGKSLEKRKTTYAEQIRKGQKIVSNFEVQVSCCTSKIYLQQMDCFVYSEEGVKIMSPLEIPTKISENIEKISGKDLNFFMKELKNLGKVSYQNKINVQKTLKMCENYFNKPQIQEFCRLDDLPAIQMAFVDLLGILGGLITEGEDIINEKIWEIIDIIIHRPELTSKCLHLIDKKQIKQDIGIKYYSFLCNMISKIVMCTTVGLEYRELKCTQKFIAYAFFRYPWVQRVVVNAIKRENDQMLTDEKLMEIGAFPGCRSPAKNILYDWQQCLYNQINKLPKYKQKFNEMMETVNDVPHWAQIIFNRDDDELFYGLLIELWNQADIFLLCNGKILWEYFPFYGELLGAFLGQMQSNQIIEYSPNFMSCSIKLMSNEKLLNIFVKLLFQKTHLYKIYYVVKALQIIRLYFQAISKQNKLIPKEFNFNYFYTGITSIFQSNHSILLIKVLVLLYDYYHIFNLESKNMLDRLIFKRSFYQIFLHWCGYVRKIFYYFLEFKVTEKFKQHHKNLSMNECTLGFQSIEMMHLYENLMFSLEQQEKSLKDNDRKCKEGAYHLKMKEKLMKRMKIKEQLNSTPEMKYSLHLSHSMCQPNIPESPPIHRHKRSFQDFGAMTDMKMNRKYSVGNNEYIDDFSSGMISQNNRKYIQIGMREYRMIKQCLNPDKNVHSLLHKFQGSKQTQIS